MKKMLRKMVVEKKDYVYSINSNYLGNEISILTVRIYLKERKQTPLVIAFKTKDDYFVGNVLHSGIELHNTMTNTIEHININEPKMIKKLMLHGLQKGWTGYNQMEIQDGVSYLSELGYDTNLFYFEKNGITL